MDILLFINSGQFFILSEQLLYGKANLYVLSIFGKFEF